ADGQQQWLAAGQLRTAEDRLKVRQQLLQETPDQTIAVFAQQVRSLGVCVANLTVAGADQHALLDGVQNAAAVAQGAADLMVEVAGCAQLSLQKQQPGA